MIGDPSRGKEHCFRSADIAAFTARRREMPIESSTSISGTRDTPLSICKTCFPLYLPAVWMCYR
jgi:hypothetical protein